MKQLQNYVKRDLRNHGISEGKLGYFLKPHKLSRTTISNRLGLPISTMFYNDCEEAIGRILKIRQHKYAEEDK